VQIASAELGIMRWHIIAAVIACVLFRPSTMNGARQFSVREPIDSLETSGKARKESSVGTSRVDHADNFLLKKAEESSQRAVVLREKQTSSGLLAATRLFRKSSRLFAANRSYDKAADSHLQIGEIYLILSEFERARTSFGEAFKVAQDPELQCRALSGSARIYASIGPYSLADTYSRQAFSLCDHLSERAQAEALEARGEVLRSRGDYSGSVDCLKRARDLFVAAKNDNGQAQALLMLAHALFQGGERLQALQAAGAALRLWSVAENRYGVAQVRAALGIFAVLTGEFETAQCNYTVARPLYREIGDRDDEASVLNGLGLVSRQTGDWEKSLEYYRTAKAAFASVQDLLGEHESIDGMGKTLTAMKNYKVMLPLYLSELRLARRANNPVFVASAFANLASAYEAENRYAQAEKFYRRSRDAYYAADHIYGESETLIRLGRLEAKQRKYSQAIASLKQANSLKEKMGQIEEIAEIQFQLAWVYRQLDRLDDSRLAIEKTIAIVENQRISISHFDTRALYFASVHRYYALYVQVLMLLHQREPELGFARKAFEASERSKVRSLLDLLTTSDQDAPCDELLRRQLAPVESKELRAVDLKQIGPSVAPTLTLEEVQAEIGNEDTILIEYALGDENSYVWVVDQHEVTAHELPKSARIRDSVDAFRKALAPPQLRSGESAVDYQARVRKVDQAYRFHAQQLSRLLLGPIPLAAPKRILIVPDESLQYIPFAALPFPSSAAGKELLINRFEVDILPSASVLGTLRKATAKRTPPTATAAIFADPVFEPDDKRVSTRPPRERRSYEERPSTLIRAIRDVGGSQYIARLPASRDEANAIANVLRSRDSQAVHVALDFDASRAYVLSDGLTRFRLVHFATHGMVDARHPEMSGLILSLVDRKGRRQDGYLRLGDIYKLKLSADLVVLSSCDSALGKDLESEGIIGLPRGFLYAGARSVIASLWKVNDDATATLMSRLYARIKKGESPGSALRGAQLEMVQDEQWSNPYYWAAFVLQGDYR
jgi:CHAT domain-containing protein/tetratricopeptide (TPR) repeat protein